MVDTRRAIGLAVAAALLSSAGMAADLEPRPVSRCLRQASALEAESREALERALRTFGFEPVGGRWIRLACRVGQPPASEATPPRRAGRPAAVHWELGSEGVSRWLAALHDGDRRPPEAVDSLRSADLSVFTGAGWYAGAPADGPQGDVIRVRTLWDGDEGGRRFARTVETALRGTAPALDRVRDWRVRAGGESVEVELLARPAAEVEPIGDDPWGDVEFGRNES